MLSLNFKSSCVTLACMALSTPVLAEQSGSVDNSLEYLKNHFSGSLAVTSDYVFRGITQSNEEPALQGNLDYTPYAGLKFGVWGSQVEFNDADLELDFYGSYSHTIDQWTGEAGLIYYYYPGAASNLNYDFIEPYAKLTYDFNVLSVSGSLNYSPNYFADSGTAYYSKLAVRIPLPNDFAVDSWVGRQTIDKEANFGVPDYTDWGIGVSYVYDMATVSVQYTDTNLSGSQCADGCSDRVILNLALAF